MKDVSGTAPWPMHAVPVREWAHGTEPGYLPGTSPGELGTLPELPQEQPPPDDDPGQEETDGGPE